MMLLDLYSYFEDREKTLTSSDSCLTAPLDNPSSGNNTLVGQKIVGGGMTAKYLVRAC